MGRQTLIEIGNTLPPLRKNDFLSKWMQPTCRHGRRLPACTNWRLSNAPTTATIEAAAGRACPQRGLATLWSCCRRSAVSQTPNYKWCCTCEWNTWKHSFPSVCFSAASETLYSSWAAAMTLDSGFINPGWFDGWSPRMVCYEAMAPEINNPKFCQLVKLLLGQHKTVHGTPMSR